MTRSRLCVRPAQAHLALSTCRWTESRHAVLSSSYSDTHSRGAISKGSAGSAAAGPARVLARRPQNAKAPRAMAGSPALGRNVVTISHHDAAAAAAHMFCSIRSRTHVCDHGSRRMTPATRMIGSGPASAHLCWRNHHTVAAIAATVLAGRLQLAAKSPLCACTVGCMMAQAHVLPEQPQASYMAGAVPGLPCDDRRRCRLQGCAAQRTAESLTSASKGVGVC